MYDTVIYETGPYSLYLLQYNEKNPSHSSQNMDKNKSIGLLKKKKIKQSLPYNLEF